MYKCGCVQALFPEGSLRPQQLLGSLSHCDEDADAQTHAQEAGHGQNYLRKPVTRGTTLDGLNPT